MLRGFESLSFHQCQLSLLYVYNKDPRVDKGFDWCYTTRTLANKEQALEFLIRAERYAEARGDDDFFKWIYTNHREYNTVTDSVWKTLSYLYGDDVADLLEFQ